MHDLDAAAAGQLTEPSEQDTEPTACNYCDGPILWVTSKNGKRMPIDRDPSENGNVLVRGQHGGVLGATQAAAARKFGEQLHLHHAVSCPHASSWNRGAARDEARRGGARR